MRADQTRARVCSLRGVSSSLCSPCIADLCARLVQGLAHSTLLPTFGGAAQGPAAGG